MYYFDHSATTPLHPDVVELMHNIQKYKFGNPSSTHKKGREAKLIIENSRNQIAHAIGVSSKNIIFTSGGTESNNQVLWSMLGNKKKSHSIKLYRASSCFKCITIFEELRNRSRFGIC